MASMATAEPLTSGPFVSVGSRSRRIAWLVWIGVSVAGSVAGALAAWQVRSLVQSGPAFASQDLAYVAVVASSLLASGCQWLVLRRHKLDVAWWVPGTVVGNLLNAMVVIPSMLHLFVNSTAIGPTPLETAVVAGAAALGAAGLVVGGAQALVLRASTGNFVWAWIPATAVGGALSGAITTALSAQLFGLTAVATISLVAAAGALLTAACQAPVFLRLIR